MPNGRPDDYPWRPAGFSGSARQAVQISRAGDQEKKDCKTTGCMR